MKNGTVKILGINFFKGEPQDVVNVLKNGGLLVVPAAPALSTIKSDPQYYQSLLAADVVIADSGYMSMLWNFTHKKKVTRISGLQFMRAFLADEDVKNTGEILMVDPRPKEAKCNLDYLKKNSFKINNDISYLAPMYNKQNVVDEELLALIEQKKPKYIIINLGGGTQEKLGAYLKARLSYKPAIICTGAAIAFLTGEQASIPAWADKLFLGWLCRCLEKPKLYVPRYLSAFKLMTIMIRYKSEPAN